MPSAITRTLRVVQITDSHLFADSAIKLNGLDTHHSLQQVMHAVLSSKPDLIIFTGDLVDKPDADAYLRLKTIMNQSPVPVFCLPGNHDQPELLKQQLSSDTIQIKDSALIDNWQFVFLNSYQPNTHVGKLDDTQLGALDKCLNKLPNSPALISLHHHPVSIDSTWMDSMALDQAEDLFAVLDKYVQVKAVIWGHIHQQFEQIRKGVKLLGTPSTCVQFKPGATEFSLDDKPPGFRWLHLYQNGEIDTGVTFLADFVSPE